MAISRTMGGGVLLACVLGLAALSPSQAQPATSTISQFSNGWHDYAPMAAIPVDSPCTDGKGNNGIVVAKGKQTGPQI